MKIVVDAFGGDHAPAAILEGCVAARDAYPDVELILSGDVEKLREVAEECKLNLTAFQLVNAPTVMQAQDDPMDIRKEKADSSMAVGLTMLREGRTDAFISAGSTAALAVGASTIVKRMKGIKRAALAPVMPSAKNPFLLIDAGANHECRSEMLLQFAVMGSVYMKRVLGVENPRVGLANIGAEPSKGTEMHQEAYRLLEQCAHCRFIGNVEAREIPLGACDVMVADGFSGNMILKTMEGMGGFFVDCLRGMFTHSVGGKIAAVLVLPSIKRLKKRMDYTEYGGAMLMGIAKPVIKAHGSSNANAVKNAIRQARLCVENRVIEEMMKNIGGIEYERK